MAKRTKKKKKTSKDSRSRDTASDLSKRQSAWDDSEARSFGAPLPDDAYTGTIENAIIETSRNGRLQVRWDLLVTEGSCEGRQVRKYSGLETKDNMDWFKGDLETLGLDIPDDINNLGDSLEQACGLAVSFQVRTRDEFTNIDFIEPLEEAAQEAGEAKPTAKDVQAMNEDELTNLAADHNLNPNDYDTWEDLAEEIIEVARLK